MITLTWEETGQPAQTFMIPDGGLASLEAYRQTITNMVVVDGAAVRTPMFATVLDMLIAAAVNNVIRPAFTAFPPASVTDAAVAVAAAQAALVAAQEIALATVLAPNPA